MIARPAAVGTGSRSSAFSTIAARDNDDSRLGGGDPYDASTILLRIRGSDLSAYRAKQITREDAVKRVEIREY